MFMRRLVVLPLSFFLCMATPAQAEYTYLHTDGEYSMSLPEAPTAKTIWADKETIPYLEKPPRYGNIGENAVFEETDLKTGDTFKAQITFLKTTPEELQNLTREKIEGFVEKELSGVKLENRKSGFSPGSGTLKWAYLSGFSVDKSNRALFNAVHFLTGMQTITVLRVTYDIENVKFNEYYKKLSSSIAFKKQ